MFETQNLYQNDERWKDLILGNSRETIGAWGGLLTSVTMMLNAIGYDETPATVNEKLIKEGGFQKALLIPSYVAYRWPNCAYRGLTRCGKRSPVPIAEIDAAVAAGNPVILQVDSSERTGIQTHFVLIKRKEGEDYALYDPYRFEGDDPDQDVFLTRRYNHNGAKLELEISAVLWFGFHQLPFPRPPKVTRVAVPKDKYTLYATDDALALRASPSPNGYPWKLLAMGTELTGLESQAIAKGKLGEDGEWIRVQDPREEQGYISARFVYATRFPEIAIPPLEVVFSQKKWCMRQVPVENLRSETWDSQKQIIPGHTPVRDFSTLPKDTVVYVLNSMAAADENGKASSWSGIMYEETYRDSGKKQWVTTRVTGWVNDEDLDDYIEHPNEAFRKLVLNIPYQTETSTDAQQYFYLKNQRDMSKIRHNMCGELCIAYVAGKDIDVLLAEWEGASRAVYDSMVGNADKPLETSHIEDIFRVLGLETFYERYKLDEQGNVRENFIRLAAPDADQRRASEDFIGKLETHYFITNLKINTGTGDLMPAQTVKERNHWVVVDRVTRGGRRVELYNPFPNKREEYTFGEFYKSVRGDPNSGWWIKREANPSFAKQKISSNGEKGGHIEEAFEAPLYQVAIDNPTESKTDAEQFMHVEGHRKTNLCGEFCVSFILTQSMEKALARWMAKPSADLSDLLTWLKAYGFVNGKQSANQSQKSKSFSIDIVLNYWQAVQPDLYNSILGGSNNLPTGPQDLKTILTAYGYKWEDLKDGGLLPTPSKTAAKLKTHFMIAGVNIDASKGGTLGGSIAHWIVVDKITPIGNLVGGNGGWVELYNPFLNRWEEYSYREFLKDYIGPVLWVPRDVHPVFERQRRVAAKSQGKTSSEQKTRKGSRQGGSRNPRKPAKTQQELVQISLQKLRSGEDPEAVARALAKQLDVSKAEAERLLGISKEEDEPAVDIGALICERLEVDSIPPEVGQWIREQSKGDALLIEGLTDALVEFGILSIDAENKKASRIDFGDSTLATLIENALQKGIDGSSAASQQIFKVVQAIGPAFASRAIKEIQEIRARMAAEESQPG